MANNNPLGLLGFGGKKDDAQDSEQEALFSVAKGNPTEEELVALTMALVAVQEQEKNEKSTNAASWQRMLNRGQRLGVRLRPGPGSWRRARPM